MFEPEAFQIRCRITVYSVSTFSDMRVGPKVAYPKAFFRTDVYV
jgi:hypothetical protein